MLRLSLGLIVFLLAGCYGVNGVPKPRPASGNAMDGRRWIAEYGCGSCHSIPGIPGADAMAAPPLDCFYERTSIAGRLANTEPNLVEWIRNPQQIDPGNTMPDLGLAKEQAEDIAAYLYTLPTGWRLENRSSRNCTWE